MSRRKRPQDPTPPACGPGPGRTRPLHPSSAGPATAAPLLRQPGAEGFWLAPHNWTQAGGRRVPGSTALVPAGNCIQRWWGVRVLGGKKNAVLRDLLGFSFSPNFSNSKEPLCSVSNEGGGAGNRLGLGSGRILAQKPSRAPPSIAEIGGKGDAGNQAPGCRQEEEAGASRPRARVRKRGAGSARRLPYRGASRGPLRAPRLRSPGVRATWGRGGRSPTLCASSQLRGPGYLEGRGRGSSRTRVCGGAGCRKKKASILSFCFPGPGFQQEPHRHTGSHGEVPAEPPCGAADPWAQEWCGQLSGACRERAETWTPEPRPRSAGAAGKTRRGRSGRPCFSLTFSYREF